MELFALVAAVFVLVPFVLPIVSWLTVRRTRERLGVLERTVEEQSRKLETLRAQLARQEGPTVRRSEGPTVRGSEGPKVPGSLGPQVLGSEGPQVPGSDAPQVRAPEGPRVQEPPRVPRPPVVAPERRPAPRPPIARPAPRPPLPPIQPPPPPAPPEPRAPFDWENLVGVKLFSAIAGVALVLAAVFFLAYSIEHGWLQPPVRVVIGLVVAIALLVVCELKAARRYPSTANALDAAAIAILFATFFAAHALWNLIPGFVAFVLLGVVTAIAVMLSIRRESLLIAVLGLLGGFATPVLLSTGENQPIPLFAYLVLLNVGLAWVAYRNRWPVLTALTLVLTTLYQWGWVLRFLRDASDIPLAMGIFLVFPLISFAGMLIARRPTLEAATSGSDVAFERTALMAAVVPLGFAVFLAAVPAYGARPALLFGFLLLVNIGLLAIAIARRQLLLHAAGAAATLVSVAAWLALSYEPDARMIAIGFTSAFVLFFLVGAIIAGRFNRPAAAEGIAAQYAAPTLLGVFTALARLDPAFAEPWLLVVPLFALMAACAWRAVRLGDGWLHDISVFFGLATLAVWSMLHADAVRLTSTLAMCAIFAAVALAAPTGARRAGRPFDAVSSALLIVLAFGTMIYVSPGTSPRVLWALAFLGAVVHASVFAGNGGLPLPAVSAVVGVMSALFLAAWWSIGAGGVGVLPSLGVVIGLNLAALACHGWARKVSADARSIDSGAPANLFTDGLFLGLFGYLFLFFFSLDRSWSLPPWPVFGAVALLTLAASVLALHVRVATLHTAGVISGALVLAAWTSEMHGAPWPLAGMVGAAAVSAYAVGLLRLFRGQPAGLESASAGAAAALLIGEFTIMIATAGAGRPPIAAVITAHAANLAVLLALTWGRQWRHVALLAPLVAWVAIFSFDGPWHEALLLAGALYVTVVAYPFVLGKRIGASRDPHLAAVLASVMFFFSGRAALESGGFDWIIGALPVLEAGVLALLLRQLLRNEPAEQRDLGRLATVAGVALAFITVAIPLQLEHQWITIGWALEGAALAWLFTRVPHRGVLYFCTGLLAAVFLRLAVNPEVFRYEPRGELRIINWYLYTYLLAAAAFFASAWWLRRSDEPLILERYRVSQLLPGGAVVLLFLLLNIEIADFYATGPEVVFRFGAGVSQDLTYTIGWLVFGVLLLAAGISVRSRAARSAAVTLIAVTAFKCFLYDLASLGGLYRVGSFVGLAIALALVSLVLQKYVLAKPGEAR